MISASSHNPRRARVVVGAHANGSALLIALAAVLLQTMMPPAMATTFNVSNTGDSGTGTLRAAFTAAAADATGAHTIIMNLGAGPATITLTTTLTMPNTRNITVDGTLSGGARVQISGSGASGGYLKPTLPTPNNGASVRFANVDFTNIGFTINANELALTNASFTSTRPQSDQFRAMSVSGARLTLRNVRVEGFNSGQTGAAIDARTSSGPVAAQVDAADFTVTGCSGQYGPGVFLYSQGYNAAPTLSCVRCLFANNTASVGGAAAFVGGGVATFERTLFAQNGATGVGGGLYIYPVNSGSSASVTITQSYFYANSATSSGGAIYAPTGALNLRNSAVVNNTAGGQGGGIYLSNAQFVLHSVTALDNSASNYQGVYLSSSAGASNMTNSIVYGAAAGTTAFALATGSASVRLTKNIIKGYSNTGSCPSPGLCATGTINANPLLVQVVDPQSDGGPVDTFWAPVSGCSPAVDSGDNTDGDAVDMRGAARVVGSAVDRGAVEFVPTGGNSPPVVTGAPTYTAYTGATISINAAAGLASYACDANGNSMTFSLVAQPAAGTVTVNSDGSIVFIAPQSPGAVTFLFAVSDGNQTVQGTATINVIAAPPPPPGPGPPPPNQNSPPTATAKSFRVVRNNRLSRAAPGLLAGATDPDTGTAGLTATTGTFSSQRGGSVVVQASGAFVYTPATDYVGTDTFTFTVRDPSNAVSSPATVTVTIDPPPPAAEAKAVIAGVNVDAQMDAYAAAEFAAALGPPSSSGGGVNKWGGDVVREMATKLPGSKVAKTAEGVMASLKRALNEGVPPLADGSAARAVAAPAFALPAAFGSTPQDPPVSLKLDVPVAARMAGLELERAIAAVVADTEKVMPAALRADVGVRSLVVAVAPAVTTCDTGDDPVANGCVCAPGDGGASCNRCGAGKFSPGGNAAACNVCEGDTYAKAGASECGKCAAPGATADKSACRKAPVRAASRSAYTASRMARLRVPVPGLLTGVTSDFAPLTVSLKNSSQNGVEQEDGSIITVNADGSFVYTPPTRKGRNATIEFRVTDANGDALEEAVSLLVTDKPPALAAPTMQSINFTVCAGVNDPIPRCRPRRVFATPRFTAGALEMLAGGGHKAHGVPKGIDIRMSLMPGAAAKGGAPTECVAPLPKLKVRAGGAAPKVVLKCPGCKRCMKKLGLVKGDSVMAAVRARKMGQLPASEWSEDAPAGMK